MMAAENYYRIMLGRKSVHAEKCHQGGFIGADYGLHEDLTGKLPEDWREFNKSFIPIYLANRPEKSKIAAGLACDAIHTVAKGISKDKKEILVVELKKGRASDVVVGQIQRYMGYVHEELAENGQIVSGVIIALEDDLRLQRALKVASNIEFYRYQVSFQLIKN
jgi:hypothetical protein